MRALRTCIPTTQLPSATKVVIDVKRSTSDDAELIVLVHAEVVRGRGVIHGCERYPSSASGSPSVPMLVFVTANGGCAIN